MTGGHQKLQISFLGRILGPPVAQCSRLMRDRQPPNLPSTLLEGRSGCRADQTSAWGTNKLVLAGTILSSQVTNSNQLTCEVVTYLYFHAMRRVCTHVANSGSHDDRDNGVRADGRTDGATLLHIRRILGSKDKDTLPQSLTISPSYQRHGAISAYPQSPFFTTRIRSVFPISESTYNISNSTRMPISRISWLLCLPSRVTAAAIRRL